MFYLKSINPKISMMIQSLSGTTLPDASSIVVKEENNLIDVGKLPPHPIIPVFPEISVPAQDMPSTSALTPPQSMYTYLSVPQNVASTFSSSKEEMSEFKEMLQTIVNEITVIKHNQVIPPKPTYQNYQGRKSCY